MADPIYIHLVPEQSPSEISVGPFKALVVVDEPVEAMWRDTICKWLVESGCLYCCVWGEACGVWHDEVDHANIRAFHGGAIPDDQFVMTTWHDKETLSEALWFVGIAAEHPTINLAQTAIIHVTCHERKAKLLEQYRAVVSE